MASGRTDPELVRQLDAARKSGDLVHAVVRLHQPAGRAPKPEHVEEETRRAVDRAEAASGESPVDVHVMGRLAVAYVSGLPVGRTVGRVVSAQQAAGGWPCRRCDRP